MAQLQSNRQEEITPIIEEQPEANREHTDRRLRIALAAALLLLATALLCTIVFEEEAEALLPADLLKTAKLMGSQTSAKLSSSEARFNERMTSESEAQKSTNRKLIGGDSSGQMLIESLGLFKWDRGQHETETPMGDISQNLTP